MLRKLLSFLFIDNVLKEDIGFLKTISVFRGLSDRSLAKVALIIFKKTYLHGEKIYEVNQESNVVYIVKYGQVKLEDKVVEAAGFFGEISLIENHRHKSDATALKDSELYLIYRARFDDMVESDNKIGLKIMKNLASIFAAKAQDVILKD